MSGDAEIRRTVALNCVDALQLTRPLSDEQADAIAWVLGRLVSTRPLSALDQAELLDELRDAGCVLAPTLERVAA